jgi:hypothetical protein
MSKLFFDHLLALEEVEVIIKKNFSSKEEKEEHWKLVDEIIIHNALEKVFDNLPKENCGEFLEIFHKCPHDEVYIFKYLNSKTGKDMEEVLRRELKMMGTEILKELGLLDEISFETKVSKK